MWVSIPIRNVHIYTKWDRQRLEMASCLWWSGFVTSGIRENLFGVLKRLDSELVDNGLWTYIAILIS